jgi:glycosyltransferase involved in cell wall biosynthesis/ubiquinone/menaquinone biosynthesis C-methylase UbiE
MNNKLKEGETLFADGKIEEAEKCFLSLIEDDSDCKEAYNNLGVVAFQKDDREKAIDYFTRSLEIDPLYRDAILNYTSLLRTLNQIHIAVPLLEKIAETNPGDKEIIQLLEEILSTPQSRSKIAILCLPGYESFLEEIVNHLKARHDVQTCYTNNKQEIESSVEWADIVWLEFANDISVYVTNKVSTIQHKTVVCRIHSYEVLHGNLPNIDFTKIDMVVFVTDHVRNIAFETYPSITNETKTLVIQNGVNLEQFSYVERTPGFNLAVVGDINNKKNPAMWIEIMSRLVNINPQYKLNVAGNIQELRYKYYLENIIHKLGLERNIRFHGRVKNIPEWFKRERINYLLTTSVFESFGYSIAEAMAMGYKPLIHNFPSAYDNWPSNCIFSTTDELINIIQNSDDYDSKGYHNFVKGRYSLSSQLDAIDSMLINLTNNNSTQATTVSSEKQENYINEKKPSPKTTIDICNLHKPHKNLIVTGIPRSGSSLFSVLINSIENAVCLNEIVYDVLKLPHAFEEIRKRLVLKTPIPNKYDGSGVLTTNTQDGIVNIEEKVVEIVDDNVVVGSKVNIPYLNEIQTILDYNYKIIAIVRDPVFTIGSWNSKKTSHLDEARVTEDNMSLRWAHIPFTTEEKIGRQAQIWQYYAGLIWSLRDRIKIYTYEQVTSNTEWVLKDVCEYLGLNIPQKTKPLENLNSESRYQNIAEIREAVKQYCPVSREFGYQYSDSSTGTYKPQEYWENRGANYEVNTKEYNSDTEIPILENIIEKNNLSGSAILEVGSGYGRIYQEVGRKCSNYTMCDFSNSMRRECKMRTNILPDYWDGLKLPYPDNSFDLVILFSVLLHVPDEKIKKFFAEISRVTGNYIFIASYTGHLSITADHVFKHDYNKIFKEEGLKTVFEKKIKDGLRTNWLVKKQPQATKLKSAKIDLLQTTI